MPLASCLLRIDCGSSAAVSLVASRMSSVSSRSALRASLAYIAGRPWGAVRSARVVGGPTLGRDCSRRKRVGRLPGLVGMNCP